MHIEEFEYKSSYEDTSNWGGPLGDFEDDIWFRIVKKAVKGQNQFRYGDEYCFTGKLAKRLYVTMLRDTHRGFCKVVNDEIAKGNG